MSFIKVDNISKSFKVVKRNSGVKAALKSFFKREYIIIDAVKNVSFEIKSQYFEGFEIKKESNSFKRKIGNPFPSSFKSSDVPYCEKDSISQPCTLLNTICSEL